MLLFGKRDPYRVLKKQLGAHKVLDRLEDRVVYSVDASYTAPPGRHDPDVVVLPETAEEVAACVRFAREAEMNIVPRGTGTGMSAGAVPLGGGMVLCTERMKAIRDLNVNARWIQVEPGLTTADVKAASERHRLTYPPDPSSYKISSIGGNLAENAGGLRCVKYGTTKDYVLGLRFVNSEGELVSTGVLADEPQPLDLTPLLVGSEGLFGVIVEARLSLVPAPKATHTLLAHFSRMEQAVEAVNTLLPEIVPSVLELMDGAVIEAIRQHDPYPFPEGIEAALLVETDGDPEPAKLAADRAAEVIGEIGALEMHTAHTPVERERLWNLRRLISPSLSRLASGKMNEDVVVPIGRLGELLERIAQLSEHYRIRIPVFGHAGDGNLHLNAMFDADSAREYSVAHDVILECFKAVVELGGTISGEHGIGAAKNRFLDLQYSEDEIKLLRSLKKAFDPDGLFNPFKVLPPS